MEVRKKWRFPGSNLIALAEDPEMGSFTRHAKAFDANGLPLTAWETQQSFSSFPGLENHIPPLSLFPIPLFGGHKDCLELAPLILTLLVK